VSASARFPEHFLLVCPSAAVAEEVFPRLGRSASPPHHRHLSSSRCPNRFKYVPTGACPDFSRSNLAASNFTLFIGMGLLHPALPFSL
jgi:hypothetical protein